MSSPYNIDPYFLENLEAEAQILFPYEEMQQYNDGLVIGIDKAFLPWWVVPSMVGTAIVALLWWLRH